jgi:hypothetical protein
MLSIRCEKSLGPAFKIAATLNTVFKSINQQRTAMKLPILPPFLMVVLLTGCVLSVPGGFSPVQGPLSKQSPIPTYSATMSGLFSGSISVVLDNGEVCKGPWTFASNTPQSERYRGSPH